MTHPQRFALLALSLLFTLPTSHAHDGPDPLLAWVFNPKFITEKNTLTAQRGPDLPLPNPKTKPTPHGLFLDGSGNTPWVPSKTGQLPTESFTVAAWCSIHEPKEYGGLIGSLQDNGHYEKGWMLGYNESRFLIQVSTQKTDDGDGKLVTLQSKTPYEKGRLYHVAATYNGSTLTLYINGKPEASTTEAAGPIIYDTDTRIAVGGYRDKDENFPHKGQLISTHLFGQAAKPAWILQEFEHNAAWTTAEVPESIREPLATIIAPYLQFGTTTGMTVMWETNDPANGTVHFGETVACSQKATTNTQNKTIHEIRLNNLKPGTQYFYQTKSIAGQETLTSEVRTFQTDAGPDTAFAFALISDTQGNPKVSGTFANLAWTHRPNFLLHPGDLVSTGKDKSHWVEHFFASMSPLVSRVPFYPVLGNHEQNAAHYYNYISVPDPEYHYTFTYGNARFFMLDTNKKCDPSSKQYQWLDQELAKSKATWNFACHHQPSYTSDENDYGNLWETNQSNRGDVNARHLTPLYDKHGVDVVFNGHIHSYERTWRIRAGKPVESGGPVYLVTGGGGGGLETPGPFRNPWQQIVRRGHHYAMIWINGRQFSYKAYDLEGKLFDAFTIDKRPQ